MISGSQYSLYTLAENPRPRRPAILSSCEKLSESSGRVKFSSYLIGCDFQTLTDHIELVHLKPSIRTTMSSAKQRRRTFQHNNSENNQDCLMKRRIGRQNERMFCSTTAPLLQVAAKCIDFHTFPL